MMDDARARVDERSHEPTVDRRGRRERYGARDASRRVASRRNVASVDARTSYHHVWMCLVSRHPPIRWGPSSRANVRVLDYTLRERDATHVVDA